MNAPSDSHEWFGWARIAEGDNAPERFDELLKSYKSAVDSPLAIVAREVYAAYPNAKFILTTRDPVKWEKSVQSTSLALYKAGRFKEDLPPYVEGAIRWGKLYFDGYNGGRLESDAQMELIKHNEYIKSIIPADQLLVYEMGEGWERLANFLGACVTPYYFAVNIHSISPL
ncbi:hypothetical protein M422DRAFT_266572 [Sphaerobolus stellatus SS14]|uniref:Protein-tyrosine sulfotransferase n=1 Tax=Sphaerobolus stellatus (strain SS14) TaxID=990650 RepID=A0A0C9UR74_SPHS4|nr:hypothetical protein M422DRAFT_266572 [Sphaerobolus stellatus SS14]